MHLKKKCLPCLTLSLLLLFSACGGADSSLSDSSASSSASALSASFSRESAASGSLGTSGDSTSLSESAAPSLPVLDQLPVGTFAYLDTEGLFPDERAPQLELLADNRATFRVNTGSEIGVAEGTVQFQGSDLIFYIQSIDMDTDTDFFWGKDLSSLPFRVLDENHLEYTGAPFGLTQRQMVFARQGEKQANAPALLQGSGIPPAADPIVPQGTQSLPQSASKSTGASASASEVADSSASSEDASASDGQPAEEDAKIPVVEPDSAPPETLKKGTSIRLAGIDPNSLVYDPLHFDAMPNADGESVTLTALLEGETTLSYTALRGEFEGQTRQFPITIEGQGVHLWLVIAIAVASAVVGGAGAVVLFVTLKKRRENREERLAAAAERKEQKAAAAVQKKEEHREKAEEQKEKKAEAKKRRKARQDAKKAKAQEKKAAKLAKKKDKRATAAAKKAAKAAQEAEKAAEKAAAAAEKTSRLTSGGKPETKEASQKATPAEAPGEDSPPTQEAD